MCLFIQVSVPWKTAMIFSHESGANRYHFHFSGMSLCPDLLGSCGFYKHLSDLVKPIFAFQVIRNSR